MEPAYLVGIRSPGMTRDQAEESLLELKRLAVTAGAAPVGSDLFEVRRISPATYLGKGQVEAARLRIARVQTGTLLVDGELSPAQQRSLEKEWGAKVIDRTGLILDIFARRAHTQEGRLQVELAQMRYLLPRLVGRGVALSQMAGGIGTRGPGETKLEFDRRKARARITVLKRELSRVRASREIHRLKRRKVPVPVVSVVGYTNAGKSTLINSLTGAGVPTEDKLFVTLDPLTRRFRLPSGQEILLTDTVGFIGRLPHPLIESFHTTFEEIGAANLILHVIDSSHPRWREHAEVTLNLLADLDLEGVPRLAVYNKVDRLPADQRPPAPDGIHISAATGYGLGELVGRIESWLRSSLVSARLFIPYGHGELLSTLYKVGSVRQTRYMQKGIQVEAWIPSKYREKYKEYIRPC